MVNLTNDLPDSFSSNNNVYGASNDALILAQLVATQIQEGLLIDIGFGTGNVGINVAIRCPEIYVLGIEISKKKCIAAQKNIIFHNLQNRVSVINGDALQINFPTASAICCNPPLLPKEIGFLRKDLEKQVLFWADLLQKVSKTSFTIYLHFFDFHGIFKRTGDNPCLKEVANSYGFELKCLYNGNRIVTNISNIRKKLRELAIIFPEGNLLVNNEIKPLKEVIKLDIRDSRLDIKVPHSIIKLYK